MLNTNVDEIIMEDGVVKGIKSGEETATAPMVICDPSYVKNMTSKVKVVGKIIRAIVLLDHPIPNTNNCASVQIIIPQKQVGRNTGKLIFILTHFFRHLHHHGQLRPRCLRQGSLRRDDLNNR